MFRIRKLLLSTLIASLLIPFAFVFASDTIEVTFESDANGPVQIDRISVEDGDVVIEDKLYTLNNDTLYFNLRGGLQSPAFFTDGMYTKYVSNEEDVILALWEVDGDDVQELNEADDDEESADIGSESEQQSDGEIRLEDGVWKN